MMLSIKKCINEFLLRVQEEDDRPLEKPKPADVNTFGKPVDLPPDLDVDEVPEEFLDPLTDYPMRQPTFLNGETYDYESIAQVAASSGKDPYTKEEFSLKDLVLNRGLKRQLETWLERPSKKARDK